MDNFSIFKNKETSDLKKPTHTISAKVGEGYLTIGCCWTRESKGGKYLSCKLSDPYNKKPGYRIEEYTDEYIPDPELMAELDKAKNAPKITDEDVENLKAIPF